MRQIIKKKRRFGLNFGVNFTVDEMETRELEGYQQRSQVTASIVPQIAYANKQITGLEKAFSHLPQGQRSIGSLDCVCGYSNDSIDLAGDNQIIENGVFECHRCGKKYLIYSRMDHFISFNEVS